MQGSVLRREWSVLRREWSVVRREWSVLRREWSVLRTVVCRSSVQFSSVSSSFYLLLFLHPIDFGDTVET